MIELDKVYVKNAFAFKNELKGAKASIEWILDYDGSIEKMQMQTKKLNLPISCFLKETEDKNMFEVRYFVLNCEGPICGHGTLVATQFLKDKSLIKNGEEVKFLPIMYEGIPPIKSKISENGDIISLYIQIYPQKMINIDSDASKEIINSLKCNDKENLFEIKNISMNSMDYIVELEKSQNAKNLKKNAVEVIKSVNPDYEKISKIKLENGDICRGVDIIIESDLEEYDYLTRIFMPTGSSIEYQEDPACGSGSSFFTTYLFNNYGLKKIIKFYQASKDGAYIEGKYLDNGFIEISGFVK